MTQQQSKRAGEQPETESTAQTRDLKEGTGGPQREEDNPKRVQYSQGFSKDHPAQPGTDANLRHTASETDKGKSSQKRSG